MKSKAIQGGDKKSKRKRKWKRGWRAGKTSTRDIGERIRQGEIITPNTKYKISCTIICFYLQ